MSWLKFKYHLGSSSKPRPFPSDIELEFEALRKERDVYLEALKLLSIQANEDFVEDYKEEYLRNIRAANFYLAKLLKEKL